MAKRLHSSCFETCQKGTFLQIEEGVRSKESHLTNFGHTAEKY